MIILMSLGEYDILCFWRIGIYVIIVTIALTYAKRNDLID